MTNSEIREGIESLCKASKVIQNCYEDEQFLVDQLNKVDSKDLDLCWNYYKDRSGVIVDLRKELIGCLLQDKIITVELLHQLVEKHKVDKEKKFNNYKNYFSIFFPPLTFYGHNYLREFVNAFTKHLILDLGIEDQVKLVSFDFQGPRQLGSDRYWIAIYNKEHENQSTGLQIFIEFFHGKISYGFYKHSDKSYLKEKHNLDPEEFNYRSMLDFFKSDIDIILNDSPVKKNVNKPMQDKDELMSVSDFPLNQILYGPPGTGKTYNTIAKAISIINPKFDLKQDRKLIKLEYQRLVNLGLIVFCTFHQSMAYEDFIEGIKPVIEESEDGVKSVVYEVKDGIFKEIALKASKPVNDVIEDSNEYTYKEAFNDLILEANDKLEQGNKLFLPVLTENLGYDVVGISDKGNLRLKPIYSQESKEYIVSFSRTEKLHKAFPDLSKVKNIYNEFREVIGGSNASSYWAALNYINNKIVAKNKLSNNFQRKQSLKPHVIIIDEINRGNVSQIFGELITLIEPDKRFGNTEAIEVVLPYSKEKFTVPSNLYLIGTMNTADRSVEALDSALRRRFFFEVMPPKYDLNGLKQNVFGFPAFEILKTINKRIEKLLDKDHLIGHAYFLNKDELGMIESFTRNIIPLLQEYFFGDYGKIGLVLGSGFIKKLEQDSVFANFEDLDYSQFEEKESYEIIDYGNDFVGFGDAIKLLMNR